MEQIAIRDLAAKLGVPAAELATYARQHDGAEASPKADAAVNKSAVRDLIERFARSRGHRFMYFDVPAYLKHATAPWARTLVSLYEDPITCPSSLSVEQGAFLRDLIRNARPKTVFEIGCFTGVSTVWIASALEEIGGEGILHSFDFFAEILPEAHLPYRYMDDPLSYAAAHLASAELTHRVRLHKMHSKDISRRIREFTTRPIDILFIDGDHTFAGCLRDLVTLLPHVAEGGLVILHDVYPASGVMGPRHVLEAYVRKSGRFDVIEIDTSPENFGMALIRKRASGSAWSLRQRASVLFRGARILVAAVAAHWREIDTLSPRKLLQLDWFQLAVRDFMVALRLNGPVR